MAVRLEREECLAGRISAQPSLDPHGPPRGTLLSPSLDGNVSITVGLRHVLRQLNLSASVSPAAKQGAVRHRHPSGSHESEKKPCTESTWQKVRAPVGNISPSSGSPASPIPGPLARGHPAAQASSMWPAGDGGAGRMEDDQAPCPGRKIRKKKPLWPAPQQAVAPLLKHAATGAFGAGGDGRVPGTPAGVWLWEYRKLATRPLSKSSLPERPASGHLPWAPTPAWRSHDIHLESQQIHKAGEAGR